MGSTWHGSKDADGIALSETMTMDQLIDNVIFLTPIPLDLAKY
jgi:hypothetical protein